MRFLLLTLAGLGTVALLLWLSWTMYDRYISASPEVPLTTVSFRPDPYNQAVEIAQIAVAAGTTAATPADWFSIASYWQQAADLMTVVPAEDDRYKDAQTRLKLYRDNSKYARQKAEAKLGSRL